MVLEILSKEYFGFICRSSVVCSINCLLVFEVCAFTVLNYVAPYKCSYEYSEHQIFSLELETSAVADM